MKATFTKTLIILSLVSGGIMFFLQNVTPDEKDDVETISVITTIDKFEALNEQLIRADKDTLVILDVDYTLLQPSNPAFQQGNFRLSPDFIKNTMKNLPESIKSEFSTSIATSGEGLLIDEKMPNVINAFKAKGARILVITGILADSWKEIPDIMVWRINNLKKYGIETSSFGFDEIYPFKDLPSYKGKYPEIKEGVIMTNGELVKKHEVLDAFLKKINWQPKKVIFVDDSAPLITAMADYFKQRNISFLGYEYKGAKLAKTKPITKEELEDVWNGLREGLNSVL